jgi:hypothetical protein
MHSENKPPRNRLFLMFSYVFVLYQSTIMKCISKHSMLMKMNMFSERRFTN